MHKTPFAGLTELDPADPLLVDGGSFLRENPSRIDRLLQVGAVSHHHDAHAAMTDPLVAPSAWTQPSGGAIPANTNIYVGYTVEDGLGGETRLSTAAATNTETPLNEPSGSISASGDYSAGSLMIGNYYYGITFLDGGGGETPLGAPVAFSRTPGWGSAQVHLSGLAAELDPPDGPVAWRLWRSTNGGQFQLLASGSGDTFLDNGVNCTDCTVQPPAPTPGSNTTRSESLLNVVLPLPSIEPVIASGAANGGEIRLYISSDGAFSDPCFYERYPLSSAGQLIQVPLLATDQGAPPDVSTCLPGANKIDPDTDLLDWHWKRPVDTFAHFPASGEFGDVRMAIDTRKPYMWVAWVASANYWEHWDGVIGPQGPAGATGATGAAGASPPGLAVGTPRLLSRSEIDFTGSGGMGVAVTDLGGGSAQVLIGPPPDVDSGGGGASVAVGLPQLPNRSEIDFAGSGGAGVAVTDLGGGSARVLIGLPSDVDAAAGVAVGTPQLTARSEIDFVASGGGGVAVTDTGGGSARVTIGFPAAAGGGTGGASAVTIDMIESVGSASWHDATGQREWIMGSASAAAGGDAALFLDTFATNTAADYTTSGQPITITGGHSQLSAGSHAYWRWDKPGTRGDGRIQCRVTPQNSTWNEAGPAKYTAANIDQNILKVTINKNNGLVIAAFKNSFSETVLATTAFGGSFAAPAVGQDCWVAMTQVGNVIRGLYYTADPITGAAPVATVTYTLAAGYEQTNFGAGVPQKPGIWINEPGTNPAEFVDDLSVWSSTADTLSATNPLHGIWGQASGSSGPVLRKFLADDGSSDFYDIPWGQRHRFLLPTASGGGMMGEIYGCAAFLGGGKVGRSIRIAVVSSGGVRSERALLVDDGDADQGLGNWREPTSDFFTQLEIANGTTNTQAASAAAAGEVLTIIGPNVGGPYVAQDPLSGKRQVIADLYGGPWRIVGPGGLATYLNGWSQAANSPVTAFRKHATGLVEFKGCVTGGTSDTDPIFTLPAGYRPAEKRRMVIDANGSIGRVYIYPNGDVTLQLGTNTAVNLDGITFTAEG